MPRFPYSMRPAMSSCAETNAARHTCPRSVVVLALTALCAITLISCSRKEGAPEGRTTTKSTTTEARAVRVGSIDFGRGLTSDRRVITTDQPFTPGDTVYAAVVWTPPVPAAQVTARWTSADGVVIYESTQALTPSEAETVTLFAMAKRAGIPPGTYKLDLLVDGQAVSGKDFTVSAPRP